MLVGSKGQVELPKFPCRLEGCTRLGFLEGGVCRPHQFDMIDWLRNRVMSRPSPWEKTGTAVQETKG